MKGCITTLPITPKTDPCINLMIQPFVMDVLGVKMGIERVLSLSSSGLKASGKTNSEADYVNSNEQLGIQPDFIWKDNIEQNLSITKILIDEMFSFGYISQKKKRLSSALAV